MWKFVTTGLSCDLYSCSQALVDMMQDIEGFSKAEVKRMCLKYPRVLTYGNMQLEHIELCASLTHSCIIAHTVHAIDV